MPREHRVEIRLLGPLEALVDGHTVTLGGPQPRALLSLLSLSAGTTVGIDRLVDGVWGEAQPPSGAANSLQVYVSRLRRALAPGTGAEPLIRSGSGGYLLDVPAEAVDATRFERLAAEGHDQLAGGHPQRALESLAEAIRLWRGRPLPDLEGDEVTAVRTRLETRFVTVRAEHADALMRGGRPADAVAELEHLVQLYPLDEALIGRLMTALYHSGRQADALATYASATSLLADELGVDPGPLLRSVQEGVLRQELDPLPAPEPAGPVERDRVREAAGTARPGGSPRPLERLRSSGSELFGREAELQRTLDLLADPAVRVVTLVGPGGIGKTRLALAVAEQVAATTRTAVVPLSTVSDEDELLATVVQVLGFEPEWPGQDLVDLLAEELGEQRVVVVLDNLEQIVTTSRLAETVVELVDRIPGLALVLTSRIALRLRDEHQVPLGPLAVPAADATDPDDVQASAAVQLFTDRARAASPTFAVTADNAAAVGELCRMLDGQPLALELAAARSRVLPPQDMVRRTGRLLLLLTGGSVDLPDRQRSMRAALDGSAQLLDEAEAGVFAQLSVFVGGWTVAAAEQVCASGEDVVDVMGRLVDKSLVVADGSGRLNMLETIREYAAERLADNGIESEHEVRRRHARYFAEFAADVGTRFSASPDAGLRAQLDDESGNLTAALTQASDDGDDTSFGQLIVGTLNYWFYTGRVAQGERWLALTDPSQLPAELRAKVLLVIGNVAVVKGDPARAGEPLDGAVEAAREVDDPLLLTRALSIRALSLRHTGQMTRALAHVDEALQIVHGLIAADPANPRYARLRGMQQNERGEILDHLGSVNEARSMFAAYRQQALADSDQGHLAWALINLAVSEGDSGQEALARELVQEALRVAAEGGSTPIEGDAQMAAGLVELLVGGDAVAAVRYEAEAARKLHTAGLLLTLPDAVSLLGAALLAAGQPTEAARMLAAGSSWRAHRGLVVVSRAAARTIADAEARLAEVQHEAPPAVARAIDDESARGAATPYGLLDALELPAAGDGARVQIHLVDLSRTSKGAATAP